MKPPFPCREGGKGGSRDYRFHLILFKQPLKSYTDNHKQDEIQASEKVTKLLYLCPEFAIDKNLTTYKKPGKGKIFP